MNVSVLIATHGDERWAELAWSTAYPSTIDQGARDVQVLHLPEGTLAQARNKAVEGCQGDWLCFLDTDDELEPGYLAAMKDACPGVRTGKLRERWELALSRRKIPSGATVEIDDLRPAGLAALYDGLMFPIEEADLVELDPDVLLAPAVRYVELNGSAGQAAIPSKGRWPDLNECVIGTLVARGLFAAVGGFRELPSLEDYDLWLRCAKLGAVIRHVPGAVYRAHRHAGSRNSNQSVYDELRREHHQVWASR